MKRLPLLCIWILLLSSLTSFGQIEDSVTLTVITVESKELRDFYRFEGIDYFKMTIVGENVKGRHFILSSNEFWDGKSVRLDTIANTEILKRRNRTDTLHLRVMSRKTGEDTTKFQFHLPGFSVQRKFRTIPRDIYSLRDITSTGEKVIPAATPITLLVYSLPYEDPEHPGSLFYCELSREGIPPERWGEEFGVQHYIIFKIEFID